MHLWFPANVPNRKKAEPTNKPWTHPGARYSFTSGELLPSQQHKAKPVKSKSCFPHHVGNITGSARMLYHKTIARGSSFLSAPPRWLFSLLHPLCRDHK